jgi:GTPase SAR1 family protein
MQGLPRQAASQFNIPLIGDANAGKASTVRRYTTDSYAESACPTAGVSTTNIALEAGAGRVELSMWDTAG